jgi:hypothetical protein
LADTSVRHPQGESALVARLALLFALVEAARASGEIG